ncbi:IucA/IucC family protein [Streptomyces sp. O3]
MNRDSTPDSRPDTSPHGTPARLMTEPQSVPRQSAGGHDTGGPRAADRPVAAYADFLEHPDPRTAAEAAAVENLLRCWVREKDCPAPDTADAAGVTAGPGVLRIPLEASGTALLVPVHYWSATGWHRFGPPALESGPHGAAPVDAVTTAALLSREAAAESGALGDGGDLVGRVADSVRRTTDFLADSRNRTEHENDHGNHGNHGSDHGNGRGNGRGNDLFLTAEQSLLLGHPLHPTPKSREGLTEAESRRYSPESGGAFPLHWMAVDRSVLATDSAWTERGRTVPAHQLTERLASPGLDLPDGRAALPLHPWQVRELTHRPEIAALLEAGLLQDLGAHGEPWHPTSSVRTLYRSGAPAMLKLPLGLRITNSRRENLHKELLRGVEVHRLLRSGLAEQWQAVHPRFDVIRDPAWLAVLGPEGTPLPGLDVMIRHNPFLPGDDASCVAGLISPRPTPLTETGDRRPMRSRLAAIVTQLAARTGRPASAVAAEWFMRYLQQVVRPVLWLDSEAGVALEAHQQNTLVLLDPEGWPAGGRYRDNQGYYYRQSRQAALERRLPGIGEHSDTFVPDQVTDERFAYYLGINNVFGLIGAFGSQRLADEQLLLAAFRRFLGDAATGPDRLDSPLPALLLDSPVLRCKANLLTRLHGLDELVGPVDTQSVYVTIANPLHSAPRSAPRTPRA